MVFAEEAIDVFEGAVGGFGVEEVDGGDEGGVEDDPDDVEAPAEGLDADRGDFNDCGGLARERLELVKYVKGRGRLKGNKINLPIKLKAQFVAVPRAAPFVRILRELISTG